MLRLPSRAHTRVCVCVCLYVYANLCEHPDVYTTSFLCGAHLCTPGRFLHSLCLLQFVGGSALLGNMIRCTTGSLSLFPSLSISLSIYIYISLSLCLFLSFSLCLSFRLCVVSLGDFSRDGDSKHPRHSSLCVRATDTLNATA